MRKLPAALALISLLAAPASGRVRDAAFMASADRQAARTSMFAGATYRISLDRRAGGQRGRASLKLAGMTYGHDSSAVRLGEGLELTTGRTGTPAFYVAGQDLGQLKAKAQLSGTNAALIVGGVLVLGVLVAVVASDIHHDNKCSEEEDC